MANNFSLWEREMTIQVRNMSNEEPENTPFLVNDNMYSWTYLIPDISKIDKEKIDLKFWNLHCDYNMELTVNPNNYKKLLTIRYHLDKNLNCKYEVEPKNFENYIKVSVKKDIPFYNISLNDLYSWHFILMFLFGLLFTIYIGIKIIDKKWILINKKD